MMRGAVSSRRGKLTCLRLTFAAMIVAVAQLSAAQESTDQTRAAEIARLQKDKAQALHPYEPSKAERLIDRAEQMFLSGGLHWHPFFDSAYAGGGFTVGAGYMQHVSPYNTFDLRGSITVAGYKRVEAAFTAPRVFHRRGVLSVVGGWREATQVGFYGIGSTSTSKDDRVNYSFNQPYASALLDLRPTRGPFALGGGVELSRWRQEPGAGTFPSVEQIYSPATLPGLGASPTYLHSQGSVGFDWRVSPGYTRRGGAYTVAYHDFHDRDSRFGFGRVDYDAVQHLPLLRETWVLSLHGRVESTNTTNGQVIPFFMLPALGGGSTLRGFASWRFRDLHSLLMQAEWRVIANRFMDMALFYDAGKVASRTSDLDFDGLKSDYGVGFRLHGPYATPLRIELAKSNEGIAIIFASKAAF
jgi:surface antigen Omp85-like protein